MANILTKNLTEGWHGVIAWDFTFDKVRIIAQAIADYVQRLDPDSLSDYKHLVFVGFDNRFLSDRFASDIAKIIRSNKIDVILSAKSVPSGCVAALTENDFFMGIYVSAGNMPYQYEGIQIKNKGKSANAELMKKIEGYIGTNPPLLLRTMPVETKDFDKDYIKYLCQKIDCAKLKKNLKGKIAVDYMFGSATGYMEALLGEDKIAALHNIREPLFNDTAPNPVEENLEELKALIKKSKALAGFAFDAEGSRLQLFDETGKIVPPQALSGIMLEYLIKNKKAKGKVVQSQAMSYMLKKIAEENKREYEELPLGFQYIANEAATEEVFFGASENGNYYWSGNAPSADGIIAALFVLEIMVKSGKPISGLIKEIEKKYGKTHIGSARYKLVKKVDDRKQFAERLIKKLPKKLAGSEIRECSTLDGLKIVLESQEWLLLTFNALNTVLELYAEANSEENEKTLMGFAEKNLKGIIA